MPWFLTRVELTGATKANYPLLHSEMKKQGFVPTFTFADGVQRHLPTTEYFCDTGMESDAVHESGIIRDRAKAAAKAAWKKGAAILVVRLDQIAWDNLQAVAPVAVAAAKAK